MNNSKNPTRSEKLFYFIDAAYWKNRSFFKEFVDHKDGDGGTQSYSFTYFAAGQEIEVEVSKDNNMDEHGQQGDEDYEPMTYDYNIRVIEAGKERYLPRNHVKTHAQVRRIWLRQVTQWKTESKAAAAASIATT